MKTCKICKVTKELTEFNPASKYKDKIYYRGECKPCNLLTQSSNNAAQIKYRESEKGKLNKNRHKKTRKYRLQQNQYEKERRDRDSLYKCKKNLRDRLNKALKVNSWKKDTHFSEYIGCSQEELKLHIEKGFIENMIWDNYGHGIGFWTIDHIIPLSSAKTEEEMYKLCHYSNLQPMWYLDNIKKSNKV